MAGDHPAVAHGQITSWNGTLPDPFYSETTLTALWNPLIDLGLLDRDRDLARCIMAGRSDARNAVFPGFVRALPFPPG